jgi:hypothetical protein
MGDCYVWLTEGLYDKEYIKTHSIGFEYIERGALGQEDGIAKTPEWAEPICGVPARIIKALAASGTKMQPPSPIVTAVPLFVPAMPTNLAGWKSFFWPCKAWGNPDGINSNSWNGACGP